MSDFRFVWLLNLDAELELSSGPSYNSSRAVEEAMRAQREVTRLLTLDEPSFFFGETKLEVAPEPSLLPWCPTWRTSRLASRLGKRHLALSSPEVLREVSSREFLVRSGARAPEGRTFVATRDELERAFARTPENDQKWRLKRRFGAQGRGQRTLGSVLRKDDENFLAGGFRSGGFLLEPELHAPRERSLHGMLFEDEVRVGCPCLLAADANGSVTHIERAENEAVDFATLAEPVLSALSKAGYRGPFGIDFLGDEREYFVSDVNPRFTLGWSIGMGKSRRPSLEKFFDACARAGR